MLSVGLSLGAGSHGGKTLLASTASRFGPGTSLAAERTDLRKLVLGRKQKDWAEEGGTAPLSAG